MAELIKADLCVIGGGAGGLAVATSAAAFGVPVVLVEKGQMGGSRRALLTKALMTAAGCARMATEGAAFGIHAQPTVDFARVRAYLRDVLAKAALNESKARIAALGVRVVEGTGRFVNPASVTTGNDDEIKARRFVVATGSAPIRPPISGLDATPFLTPDTISELTVCPSHLIVLGAGRTGLALAQAFRRLGAEVTVLDNAEPLSRDDPECTAIVLDRLAREGVAIRGGGSVGLVGYGQSKVQVVLGGAAGGETVEGSHLLVATGRRPQFEGLALDDAGIKVGPQGIIVGKGLTTSNRQVYAIGDVSGAPRFAQAASYEASLVIRNAVFHMPIRVNRDLVPRVTFTDPELAHVGLTEAEARRRGYAIRVLRWPYQENDRAMLERVVNGHIKVVTNKGGDVLGCSIVGVGAGESIVAWSVAVAQGLNIRALAGSMVPYPTFAEIGKRAAMSYFTPSLTSPLVRRIIAWVRRLR